MAIRVLMLAVIISMLIAACAANATDDSVPQATQPSLIVSTVTTQPAAMASPDDPLQRIADWVTPVGNCRGAPRIRLIVQERGQVVEDSAERLNMRDGPGTDYDIITRIEPGETFFVLAGPECADAYAWFRVRYGNREGWLAEGDPQEYYVQPYLPG